VSPVSGSINVPLTPQLEWAAVPDAEGYLVTIGMTPDTAEVLDNLVFTTNSTLVLEFDPNRTFFITVIPFNDAGEALGCIQETFSTVLGCGPYLDSVTGELIDLAPEINFPDEVSFCQNEIPYTVSTTDTAEGYRWYKIDTNGNETLISSTAETNLSTTGVYRYEAYNSVSQSGNTVECSNSKEFTVVSSEKATITSLDTSGLNGSFQIAIQVTGNGDYEFALDQIDGPYQNSNIFSGLSSGSYIVYVRDKNGCGIVEDSIIQDLTLEGFPNFFSPNGDGINDYWQFIPPVDTGEINVGAIYIFDRYGNLIKQIDPLALGWNGQINGAPMPASDYWFTAISLTTQKKIKGHFALKR
jgi:gliding motility-associated-like protein